MEGEGAFVEIQVAGQKKLVNEGVLFPTVVSPSAPVSVVSLTESIKTQKPFLESLLHKSGVLLLRGFPLTTPSHFNDVVEAFGYDEHSYTGGARRTNIVGRVYTANEAPLDLNIPFHHELAAQHEFPSKLFFFCEVEPASGGETPVVLSHVVYERMKDKYPEFVERLEKHGLLYTRFLTDDDNPSSAVGRGWKSIFSTTDKTLAQQRAGNVKLEWLEDGVKIITGPLPGVRFDESRKRKVWFNSMTVSHTSLKNQGTQPVKASFGDGEPIPSHILYDCLNIMEEESVAIPWQKGDILLIDNWAVLHSRRSCIPPRRVLASLVKFVSGESMHGSVAVALLQSINEVVEAFGYDEYSYAAGVARRTNIVGRVYTANEAPLDINIPFHHELASYHESPSKLFFFCEVEPSSGGETAIVLSHVVYDRMNEKYPEFVERLEKHGLLYTRFWKDDDNHSSPIGSGWKSIFSTTDKTLAQQRAAKQGMKLEWLEDGVKTVTGPLSGVKFDENRKRKTWFNNMTISHTSLKNQGSEPAKVSFGDGEPLPSHILYDCLNTMEEESVAIPWQKGDILLIDNWAVLHSRRSCIPPRRVLASLVK